MALRYQGFEVASAATGQEAISQVTEFRPHLMVLDVMLPDMEGFEVAERIGAQRAGVPIVFLTARDATPDKVRGLTAGGDDYVTKPFSLEELVARIRATLRPHRAGHAGEPKAGVREPRDGRGHAGGDPRGTADRAHRHGIPAAALGSAPNPRPAARCFAWARWVTRPRPARR